MTVFYNVEPQNSYRRCKLLFACLKDPFYNCRTITDAISAAKSEEEHQVTDSDDEVIISAIRSGALEKLRKKPTMLMSDSFFWVYSSKTKELYVTPKGSDQNKEVEGFEEREEFMSVKSCFSCRSSTDTDRDVFVSAQASFSQSSSLNEGAFKADLNELQRRSIIREFCHCEGWPFGLCRRVVLLPPLPKSPSESWSWRKDSTKTLKLTYR